MSEFLLDPRQVRRNAARAANTFERHDALQREVQGLLIEHLVFYQQSPGRVVDLGAGTGRGTALLKKLYPKAEVIAIDAAVPMLDAARRHSTWRRPFLRVAGEATALPLADASVDILHSNLCFQWVNDLAALFAECVRVLRPGGFLVFSTLGPDTLQELRSAWAQVDERSHVGRFLDMHDVGDAVLAAGLRDPVLDVQHYTMTYSEPRKLLEELRGLGATHADQARQRGLTGKAHYRHMLDAYAAMCSDGCTPATCEVVTAHAWGPPPGQARRSGGVEIASFSVESLRGSRRKR
ncbi:MAG: malonyl-ACP O-methyltransferase BioC [Rhodanobacter sp.]